MKEAAELKIEEREALKSQVFVHLKVRNFFSRMFNRLFA